MIRSVIELCVWQTRGTLCFCTTEQKILFEWGPIPGSTLSSPMIWVCIICRRTGASLQTAATRKSVGFCGSICFPVHWRGKKLTAKHGADFSPALFLYPSNFLRKKIILIKTSEIKLTRVEIYEIGLVYCTDCVSLNMTVQIQLNNFITYDLFLTYLWCLLQCTQPEHWCKQQWPLKRL